MYEGYFPDAPDEINRVWTEASITFDTNVLLEFFRGTESQCQELKNIISSFQDRFFVTNQAFFEVASHWRTELRARETSYSEIIKFLEQQKKEVISQFHNHKNKFRSHPILDMNYEEQQVAEFFDQRIEEIRKKSIEHEQSVSPETRVENFLDSCKHAVLDSFSDTELNDIYNEGKQRYAKKRPPGYKDEKKETENQKYGDLIIWKEILSHSANKQKDVIFVTNDVKEDWWLEISGQKYGARPELVEEMIKNSGKKFYVYTLSRFMEKYSEMSKKAINKNVINAYQEYEDTIRQQTESSASTSEMETFEKEIEVLERECEAIRQQMNSLPPEASGSPLLPWGKQWHALAHQLSNKYQHLEEMRRLRDTLLS